MATLQDLRKLFVLVAADKCATFRANYITPPSGQSRKTNYDNKIVFLADTRQIWTRDKFFSLSYLNSQQDETNISELQAILNGFASSNPQLAYQTVAGAIDEILAGLTNTGVISISRGSNGLTTYSSKVNITATSVAGAYTGIQLGGDNGFTYSSIPFASTKEDISGSTYFPGVTSKALRDYVEEKFGDIAHALTFEGGSDKLTLELASTVLTEKNVGDYFVIDKAKPTSGETGYNGRYNFIVDSANYSAEIGDSVIVSYVWEGVVKEAIIVERNLTGAVTTASTTLEDNHVVLGAGNQTVKNTSYILGDDATTVSNFASTNNTLATEKAVKNYVEGSTKITSVEGVGYIDVTYSYSNGIYTYYTYAYTQSLIDATGITYDTTTGKWVAADDPTQEARPGLAVAYDVAYELVKDERVIAAALNDHETRINDIETGGAVAGLDANITYESAYMSYQVTETNGIITFAYVNVNPLIDVLRTPWETYGAE